MSLISRGQSYLNRALGTAAGVSVTYARGAQSVTLTAWVGRTVFGQLPSGQTGGSVVFGDADFLIPVSALVLAAVAVQPSRGDRVTWAGLVYEIVAPGGDPPWRYSDQTRTVYRIHCKRVS